MLKKYEKALIDLNAALKIDPKDTFALIVRGEVYCQMGRYQDAERDFTAALAVDPKNDSVLYRKGNIYRLMGRYQDAEQYFTAALTINPKNGYALSGRGDIYCKMGRLQDAERDFTATLAIDPNNSFALSMRGHVYCLMDASHDTERNLITELADLNAALETNPKNDFSLAKRGDIYRLMGKFQDAEQDLTAALTINPTNAFALARRGDLYLQMGNHQKALIDLNAALIINPKSTFALSRRIYIYRLMYRYQDAERDLTAELAINPNNAFVLAKRSDLYRLMGEYEKALIDLNSALALEPNNSLALTVKKLCEKNNSFVSLPWAKDEVLIRPTNLLACHGIKINIETSIRKILNHNTTSESPDLLRRFLESSFETLAYNSDVDIIAIEMAMALIKIHFNEHFLKTHWFTTINAHEAQRLKDIEALFDITRPEESSFAATLWADITTRDRAHRRILTITPKEGVTPDKLFELAAKICQESQENSALSMLAVCLNCIGTQYKLRCVQIAITELTKILEEIKKANDKICESNAKLTDLLAKARAKLDAEIIAKIEAQEIDIENLKIHTDAVEQSSSAVNADAKKLQEISGELKNLSTKIEEMEKICAAKKKEYDDQLRKNMIFIQKASQYLLARLGACTVEIQKFAKEDIARDEKITELKNQITKTQESLAASEKANIQKEAAQLKIKIADLSEQLKDMLIAAEATKQIRELKLKGLKKEISDLIDLIKQLLDLPDQDADQRPEIIEAKKTIEKLEQEIKKYETQDANELSNLNPEPEKLSSGIEAINDQLSAKVQVLQQESVQPISESIAAISDALETTTQNITIHAATLETNVEC